MAFHSRQWTRQPPLQSDINPLLRADFAWNATSASRPIVGPLISGGAVSLIATPEGTQASGGHLVLSAVVPSTFSLTWTEIGVAFLDATSSLFTLSARGSAQAVIFQPALHRVNLIVWGASDVVVSGGALPVGVVRYVARRSGVVHHVWINGALYGSATSPSVGSNDGTLPAIGAHAGSGPNAGTSPMSATVGIGMVVRTPLALSDDLCASFSRNPWQLFAPRRIWVPQAAITGLPTLSLPTYTPGSLTATGFRPRVTAT